MRSKEWLEKRYLGRRVKTSGGATGTVVKVTTPEDTYPIHVNMELCVTEFWPPHMLTLLKPKKKRPPMPTREEYEKARDKCVAGAVSIGKACHSISFNSFYKELGIE